MSISEIERATPREHRSRCSTSLHLVDRINMVGLPQRMVEDFQVSVSFWLRLKGAAPDTTKFWWEDANCHEMDPTLFEPSLEGRARRETKLELNEQKMEQARKACSDCPVWHLCYQKAQESDFYYTMRAGIEPGQLTEYRELGRVGVRTGQERERCVNGHNDWVVWGKKRPRKKCRQCSVDAAARKRQAKVV